MHHYREFYEVDSLRDEIDKITGGNMRNLNYDTNLPIKTWADRTLDDDTDCIQQAINIANHPVAHHHIALMADAHLGFGVPIGTVFGAEEALIPMAVGVDIGCGMRAMKTDICVTELNWEEINEIISGIKENVPVGKKWRKEPYNRDLEIFDDTKISCDMIRGELYNNNIQRQLCTLGGGNHFIELQEDEEEMLWVMVHCGSRNIGKRIGDYYHEMAKKLNDMWKSAIPSKDLPFLPHFSEMGMLYREAMEFATNFARVNRMTIMNEVFKVLEMHFDFKQEGVIDVHHNYASWEYHFGKTLWVHRKGATSAKKDELGIIPGSMGSSSFIVNGKGNPMSFTSCSHGAGRALGRKQANRELNKEEADEAMKGIVFAGWSQDKNGNYKLEEAPQAYKSIDDVMHRQEDLVGIVHKLSPLGVVKE